MRKGQPMQTTSVRSLWRPPSVKWAPPVSVRDRRAVLTHTAVKWPLWRACKKAGLRLAQWRVLRHAFAVWDPEWGSYKGSRGARPGALAGDAKR